MKPFHVRGTERAILSIKMNFDGDLFFTGGQDGTINCWTTENGERLGSYKASGAVKTLDVTDNSEYLVSGSLEGSVNIFKVEGGVSVGKLTADFRKCKWVEFAYGDKELLIVYLPMGSQLGYEVRIVKFADVLEELKNGKDIEVNNITTHMIDYYDVKITQASWGFLNQSIVICSSEGELILLKYPSFQQVKKINAHEGEIKQIRFSKDFSLLASAAHDGCKLFDPDTLEILRQFKYEVPMNSVIISPLLNYSKPHLIVAGGIPARETARTKFQGFDIHICNVIYEEEVGKILNPNQIGPINDLQFFPDGKGFITGEEGGYSRVYKFDSSYWQNDLFK